MVSYRSFILFVVVVLSHPGSAFNLPPLHHQHRLRPQHAARTASSARVAATMRVVPISRQQMLTIVPRKVTQPQLLAYWGMNAKERLQRILEAVLISYGGTWLAWFVSFMAGSLVSAFLGTALIFNWLYSPWLNAKTRNSKMYPRLNIDSARKSRRSSRSSNGDGDGDGDVFYALFLGRIDGLRKVKRRAGKTIGAVAQEYLVMTIKDEQNRELEVITQWQTSYSSLRQGMLAPCALASSDATYSDVFCVSDVYVPALGVCVGDYPYLQEREFRRLVDEVRAEGAGEGTGGGGEGRAGVDWLGSGPGPDGTSASTSSTAATSTTTATAAGSDFDLNFDLDLDLDSYEPVRKERGGSRGPGRSRTQDRGRDGEVSSARGGEFSWDFDFDEGWDLDLDAPAAREKEREREPVRRRQR